MRTSTVSPIDPEIEQEVLQMLRSGAALETVILKMRLANLNKIECMKLLRDHAGMSLFEAKRVVHLSEVWADRLVSDNILHEAAFRALKIMDPDVMIE